MSYNPVNPNGQTTKANSAPVTLASDQGALTVTGSSTGAAVPATAVPQGQQDGSGNLVIPKAWAHGINSATAMPMSVLAAELDDVTPTSATENQAATLRMSANRNLYMTMRDAAGNERGANVNASNQLSVSVDNIPTVTVQQATAANLKVDLSGTAANATAIKVDGSAVTQPVSTTSLPLPTGAATASKQPALGTAGSASADVLTVQGIASMTALKVDGSAVTQPVSGTFWQTTQPVSAASLPLPTGAATAAKQPALGTAGSASTDVLTVQGIASMTALKVDGSAVTQPVSLATNTPTLQAGTNTIGDVNLTAAARGGYSVSSQTNLTTTATVSGAAGKFGGFMFSNLNAAPAYLQVFDTTGAVTLGSTAPTFVIPIPANATAANGVAAVHEFSVGIAITNGIKVAATTTATGATTVSTGLTGFILYK